MYTYTIVYNVPFAVWEVRETQLEAGNIADAIEEFESWATDAYDLPADPDEPISDIIISIIRED